MRLHVIEYEIGQLLVVVAPNVIPAELNVHSAGRVLLHAQKHAFFQLILENSVELGLPEEHLILRFLCGDLLEAGLH